MEDKTLEVMTMEMSTLRELTNAINPKQKLALIT
jgi:hypothetical protein